VKNAQSGPDFAGLSRHIRRKTAFRKNFQLFSKKGLTTGEKLV
jgi:hypothetical protein